MKKLPQVQRQKEQLTRDDLFCPCDPVPNDRERNLKINILHVIN